MNTKGSGIRLTTRDFEELFLKPETGKEPHSPISWQTAYSQRPDVLEGRFECCQLMPGLKMHVCDLRFDHEIEVAAEFDHFGLVCVLTVEGVWTRIAKDARGRVADLNAKPGSNQAGIGPSQPYTLRMKGGRQHRTIRLDVNQSALTELLGYDQSHSSESLLASLFSSEQRRLLLNKALSPALRCITHQILHCPMTGASRRLFLESKAMEIMAHNMEELSGTAHRTSLFSDPEDLRRLHHARDILDKEFADPPGLLALARRVGLNDFKLKRGFRNAFGTTVYGYVRNLRLEMARSMLEHGSLSVIQVALEAGYSSPGHFAALFKKRFGVLPSHYRSQKR